MECPDAVLAVLRHERLTEPSFLGAGEDSYVFEYSDTLAIKVFVGWTHGYVAELAGLYELLARHKTSFECPRIHEIKTHEDTVYTIEAKLPGTPLPQACTGMGRSERQTALANYLRAVGELATFDAAGRDYGGLLPTTVWLTAPTWGGFLRAQLATSLQGFAGRVVADFPRLQATVARLEAVLDDGFQRGQRGLVHGDYLPQNVLIGEDCSVSAVLDFGFHSMVGDTRLDLCTAVGFLELDASFTPADTSYLREPVATDQTVDEAWVSAVYGAYSAIVLGSAYSSHAGVYRWCLETLDATFGRF